MIDFYFWERKRTISNIYHIIIYAPSIHPLSLLYGVTLQSAMYDWILWLETSGLLLLLWGLHSLPSYTYMLLGGNECNRIESNLDHVCSHLASYVRFVLITVCWSAWTPSPFSPTDRTDHPDYYFSTSSFHDGSAEAKRGREQNREAMRDTILILILILIKNETTTHYVHSIIYTRTVEAQTKNTAYNPLLSFFVRCIYGSVSHVRDPTNVRNENRITNMLILILISIILAITSSIIIIIILLLLIAVLGVVSFRFRLWRCWHAAVL